MTIRRKSAKPVAAGNLHYPNETTVPLEESDTSIPNNQDPEELTDPEDDTGGSTHFPNEMTTPPADNGRVTMAKTKAKASAQAKAAKRLTAAEDPDATDMSVEQDPNASKGPNPNQTFTSNETGAVNAKKKQVKAGEDCGLTEGPTQQQNVGTLPNEEDPAEGYLPQGGELNASEEDEEDLADEEDEVVADFDEGAELDNGQAPQQMLEEADWDEEGDGMPMEDAPVDDAAIVDDMMLDAEADELDNDMPGEPLDIVDVDGTEDNGDDVAFATMASKGRVLVLKGARVVAFMTKKQAVKADKADVYLSEQFEDVTTAEINRVGLRAGLKSMGFVMAKVNVGKSEVLNKRVEAKVKQVTAATRRVEHSKAKALEQCMAIAAVGINRQHFPGATNELRAALEDELTAAGVRNASKLVRRVFASHGVSYAKAIVTVATKLQAMPEIARNTLAETLDMTDDANLEDDSELFGDEEGADFQAEAADDDGFAEDFDEGMESPNSIQAALVRPVVRRTELSASAKARTSVTAASILSGNAPLPFAR